MYSFKAKIASRGYHTYSKRLLGAMLKKEMRLKLSSKLTKVKKKIDPYACAIRAKEEYFKGWKTVGHNPERNFEACLFFYKIRGRFCQWDSNINKITHVTNTS